MKSYIDDMDAYRPVNRAIWEKGNIKKTLALDWNESTIPPSPHVISRICELATRADFYNIYPDTNTNRLKCAIADYLHIDAENILPFPSSDTLHEYIARAWLRPGDTALLPWPTYDNFRSTAESSGASVLYYERDIQDMMAYLEKKPQLVYICNPNNPTGVQLPINLLISFIQSCPQSLFVIDEAYAEFSGQTITPHISNFENVLVTRTFSKAFGLANFRIGYAVASKKNINRLSAIRNVKNIPTFSQEAAIAALNDIEYMQAYVKEVVASREWFIQEFEKLKMKVHCHPSSANFVLIDFDDVEEKKSFVRFLMDNKIYVRELCQAEWLRKSIRITVGTRKQMDRVLRTARGFIKQYENSSI